jgi:hypothetical protein
MQLAALAARIKVLFASAGTKNTVPDLHSAAPSAANAAYDTGFPAITMTPISAGGSPPFGADFNGLLYAVTAQLQALQAGAVYAYDSTFATAIGGYAKGAILINSAGTGYWVCTADNNTTDPDGGSPANWLDFASFLGALGKYIDPAPAGSANVITASITLPTLNAAFQGVPVYVRAGAASTITNPTYAGKTMVKGALAALAVGDIAGAGHWLQLQYDSTADKWVLLNPATGVTSASTQLDIDSVGASVASNALTATHTRTTPLAFRNPTLTNGAPVSATPGSLSINVPSGATLGTVSGQAARLVLLDAYNGGTPVLCIANIAGGLNLDETTLISPTTISGSSNSAGVIYSASSVSANSPFRVRGFIDITEATAGTWASAPTVVQGTGGQALTALSSLGYGQTWQAVSRTNGTTYYNTTGKPIMAACSISSNGSAVGSFVVTINGTAITVCSAGNATTTGSGNGVVIIPPGASYVPSISNGNGSLSQELR